MKLVAKQILLAGLLLLLCSPPVALGEDEGGLSREEKVRRDKARVEKEGFWLYNDLPAAYQKARETGKPILVVLRCLPCEECVKLDDDLVDNDPVIRPLLEQFVCVRVVGTNGLDLDVFQYDTDQSFAVFMLAADKTVYGRFGTRSHRTEWLGDVSLEGMAAALSGALELHRDYPNNKAQLVGKSGKPLEFDAPEKFPKLRGKYTDRLNYSGDVVKSCIHCHQIGEARREFYWQQNKPIPERLFFSYPHPKSIGLILDPDTRSTVKSITQGSPASVAKLEPGDTIETMQGQPILSIADVQWVLHNTAAEGAKVTLGVQRGTQQLDLELQLAKGWRQADDISWRVSSWTLCRIATGGMRLVPLDDEQRVEYGVPEGMALRAKNVGRYGPHGAAMRAGFQKNDIIVSFDGRSDFENEDQLFYYVNRTKRIGDSVEIEYVRGGKRRQARLKIQE
ncbi:MAG TPA: peptidase [Planctomycetaceae bacterium]|nr:peptidase [Planctomycetaceae bacterium]